MNASAFGGKPQEVVTPESMLFDAAERVGRIREGRLAMHIHLSRLLPRNQEDAKIRIAFRMFESMVDMFRGQMFLLTNNDIVLICKDARLADLDAIVYKLRALFSKDPLTYTETEDGEDRFVTYYDLETEYDTFFTLCGTLLAEARQRIEDRRKAVPIKPLDSRGLVTVMDRMGSTDVASVVRRQACMRFTEGSRAETAFQEFYISVGDLRRALAPDVDILANRWLFQHLSQTLDLRILSVLAQAGFRKMPSAFSLNLNVATVESEAFAAFEQSIRGRAGLVVEFQLIDIFENLDRFFRVRDRLRRAGHKTVLDSMTAITLQFLDAEHYDTDFLKLLWTPDLADDVVAGGVVDALGPVGFDRIILGHCDSESAIAWGLSQGIQHFQGRFLDNFVAAVTMSKCPKAAACTLQQCNQRHAVISGRPRAECGDNDWLDAFPPLTALR